MPIFLQHDPYEHLYESRDWNRRGYWPCRWVACPEAGKPPFATAYRLRFQLDAPLHFLAHVTADERYELYLDGRYLGRGSERGDASHWFYETYELKLAPGDHTLVARVWSLGEGAPYAQMILHPGFLFAPSQPDNRANEEKLIALLGTGVAPWESRKLGGYEFQNPMAAWGTGLNLRIHGTSFDWGWEQGIGEHWSPATPLESGMEANTVNDAPPGHLLMPGILPPMMERSWSRGHVRSVTVLESHPFPEERPESASSSTDIQTNRIPIRSSDHLPEEAESWQKLVALQSALSIPAHTRRRIILDLEDYVCAYPQVITSGGKGSRIRIHWQESLFEQPDNMSKGNRDEVEGKYFTTIWSWKDGIGDTFFPDGGMNRKFEILWWQCGRYVEFVVETRDQALTINSINFRETRYPIEMTSTFEASDSRLNLVVPMALRTLQMCSHETYMDCPYYEQLMYIGDTRLQALITYVIDRDDRLPLKALRMFDASRQLSGLTQSRYPTRVLQIIPPFSLWWVCMVHDFALWRDYPEIVREFLPGVRGVLEHFLRCCNSKGLVEAPIGWNTLDWVPEWPGGMPPDADRGVSGVINWQFAMALQRAAELEEWAGEPELASLWRRHARELLDTINTHFWDSERGLYADDLERQRFSEHAQCFAILSGLLDAVQTAELGRRLLGEPALSRTTIYFTHYLFEVFHQLDKGEAFLQRLGLWFDLQALGLKTAIEMPEPTRSDCHAWSAHPLFHGFASVLGIRPAAPSFSRVRIAPMLGPLVSARGEMPHPNGAIKVDLSRAGDRIHARVELPEGLAGSFHWNGQTSPLHPGAQDLVLG